MTVRFRGVDGDPAAERALAESRLREAALGFPAGIKQLTARRFGVSAVTRLGVAKPSLPGAPSSRA